MDRLITVKDVTERYKCSLPTARKYMRQCNPHMENPLTVPEWAFMEWEGQRMVSPQKGKVVLGRIKSGARVIVPRKRG